jgi:hypothetical protein
MRKLSRDQVMVRLRQAIDPAVGLPAEDIDQIEVLIRVGEHLVAFENLCTQLYEYDIRLDGAQVRSLREVGDSLGAKSRYSDLLTADG